MNATREQMQHTMLRMLRQREAFEEKLKNKRPGWDWQASLDNRHSLLQALIDYNENQSTRSEIERAALGMHYFRDVVQDLTANLKSVNVMEYDREIWGGSGNDHILVDSFMCPFLPLASELDVRLGHVVQKVEYGKGKGPEGAQGVVVRTSRGTFRAHRAVVTIPLGVLKDSLVSAADEDRSTHAKTTSSVIDTVVAAITGEGTGADSADGRVVFSPPLHRDRERAIMRLGVGQSIRVALLFPYVFWGNSQLESIVLAGGDRESQVNDSFD